MLAIVPIPAFEDNYIWVIRDDCRAVAVDPGEAAPLRDYLRQHQLKLAAILVTHHHGDHTDGIAELLQEHSTPVYGPARGALATITQGVKEGDTVAVPELGVEFGVLDFPGHTRDHVGYTLPGALFCGDTLFALGCGRLFEGTPQQMWRSLSKLKALPPETRVYCAHEYTQSNARFALTVDPGNATLAERSRAVDKLRAENYPTVPSLMSEEVATNPFLRADQPALQA